MLQQPILNRKEQLLPESRLSNSQIIDCHLLKLMMFTTINMVVEKSWMLFNIDIAIFYMKWDRESKNKYVSETHDYVVKM